MKVKFSLSARLRAGVLPRSGFARNAAIVFAAMRCGDLVNLAAGMWFVPRYVSPEEIGAVLPATSFATFLSLPVFAFAMTMMRETASLAAAGERGKIKSLLCGVFAAGAVGIFVVVALGALALPGFLRAMRISDSSAGALAVLAAFLGCAAPVYTDALQALKRFKSFAAIEAGASIVRFAAIALLMPVRALAGYFAGAVAMGAFRIAGSAAMLRRELAEPPGPYWRRETFRRVAAGFIAILLYQAAPLAASLVEQMVLRSELPPADSAGYYMVSRFSDFLHLVTFPLLAVMFPYTAQAAERRESTRPFVIKCSATVLAIAAVFCAVYFFFAEELLSLMPHGAEYARYAGYMPHLVAITALTACQVFYTNAEVSAGRFGFLKWFVPLHMIYPVALYAAAHCCRLDLPAIVAFFAAASLARFAFSAIAI